MNMEKLFSQQKIDRLAELELADSIERAKKINFDIYNDAQMQSQESEIIKKIIETLQHKDRAVEIGSGAMRGVKQLADAGFKEIIAIDYNKPKENWMRDIDKKVVKFIQIPIENYDFGIDRNNLVVAMNVLPFVHKNFLPEVIKNIQTSLKNEGVFVGSFFGPRDIKVRTGSANGYCEKEIIDMLEGMEFVEKIRKFEDVIRKNGKEIVEQSFLITAKKV